MRASLERRGIRITWGGMPELSLHRMRVTNLVLDDGTLAAGSAEFGYRPLGLLRGRLDRVVLEGATLWLDQAGEIESGVLPRDDNPLKHAPHTAEVIASSQWNRPYSRERAAFPSDETRRRKFWPAVGRINNVLGDRKLVCSCPPMDDYR